MSIEQGDRDQPQPAKRPGIGLSLKSAFAVLLAALCIWVGLKLAREHRADEALARHDAVLDAIIANVSNVPARTTFKEHPGNRVDLERLLGRSHPDQTTRRNAILEFDSPLAVTIEVRLDIEESLAEETAEQLAGRLVEHYATGLTGVGLKRIVSGGGDHLTALWKSKDGNLDFWVDIAPDAHARTAEVRLIFIDSQQL